MWDEPEQGCAAQLRREYDLVPQVGGHVDGAIHEIRVFTEDPKDGFFTQTLEMW